MIARPSHIALMILSVLLCLSALATVHAVSSSQDNKTKQDVVELIVRPLGLSDLTLFTEARYTRHPSMADLHSPFQDHPTSLDHFPTGSLIGPPIGTHGFGGQTDNERPSGGTLPEDGTQ